MFSFPFPLEDAEIHRLRAFILTALCREDAGFRQTPIKSMMPQTTRQMLLLYDRLFFSGFLSATYGKLDVTLPSRLTRSAGKFVYAKDVQKRTQSVEIRMSDAILFRLDNGPFELNGLRASTPQEAFLIVFEHELCHALEMALFGKTGHSSRFLSLAHGLFGHTATKHNLLARKRYAAQNGLSVSKYASFSYQGQMLHGIITYMGKAATVMVPDPHGQYCDTQGQRYAKYRVPPNALQIESSVR